MLAPPHGGNNTNKLSYESFKYVYGDINTVKEFCMKKAFVSLVLAMVVISSCIAQNANNDRRIIGTWVNNSDNAQWVFNSNGTGTRGSDNFRYGITDTMLAILDNGSSRVYAYSCSISSDGKTLILSTSGGTYIWLTKQ
jgi:hypothetical protein